MAKDEDEKDNAYDGDLKISISAELRPDSKNPGWVLPHLSLFFGEAALGCRHENAGQVNFTMALKEARVSVIKEEGESRLEADWDDSVFEDNRAEGQITIKDEEKTGRSLSGRFKGAVAAALRNIGAKGEVSGEVRYDEGHVESISFELKIKSTGVRIAPSPEEGVIARLHITPEIGPGLKDNFGLKQKELKFRVREKKKGNRPASLQFCLEAQARHLKFKDFGFPDKRLNGRLTPNKQKIVEAVLRRVLEIRLGHDPGEIDSKRHPHRYIMLATCTEEVPASGEGDDDEN